MSNEYETYIKNYDTVEGYAEDYEKCGPCKHCRVVAPLTAKCFLLNEILPICDLTILKHKDCPL